jgi:diguanylate cyclase (GGDEF)-like protein/PAS domain S-box-containing protein
MRWFLNLATQAKLYAGFGVMLVLLAALAAVAYRSMTLIQDSQKLLYQHEFTDVLDITEVRASQLANRADMLSMMVPESRAESAAALESAIRRRVERTDERVRRLLARNQNNAASLERLQKFESLHRSNLQTRESETLPLIRAGRLQEARELHLGTQAERDAQMEAIADAFLLQTEQAARAALERSALAAGDAARVFLVAGIIGVLLAAAMTLLLNRVIAEPLKKLSAAAERVAAGDLNADVPADGRADETGILLHTFARMLTSLRAMTRDLSTEKQLLHNLMDSVPDAIFFKDREHRFLRINRVHARLLGLPRPEDAVGRPTSDFFPPDEARQRDAEDDEVLRTATPFPDKIRRISSPGGKARWSSTTKAAIKDDSGQVTGLVGIARDVTERQRLQEELAEREAGLRRAQLMAKLAHVITLPDGAFESWSETLPRLIGVQAESMPKSTRGWLEFVHPDDQDRFRERAIEAGASAGRLELEYRLRRTDGVWIDVLQVSEPMPGDSSGLTRWFGTLQDVTEQKRSREQLQASESLKGAVLEASLDSIVTIDHEGKIVEFNPAAERTFGFAREQVIGKTMVDLIVPPQLRDAHRRGFAHYLATGEGPVLGKRLELSAIRADGTEFPIELAITPIKSGSTPMFTGFIRDTTERRDSERKIRRLNRVYAVLSGINTLIVRERDRGQLFREACRIAVEAGELRFVWIGVADHDAMQLKPAAWHGEERDFLAAVGSRLSLSEKDAQGRSLVAQAAVANKAMISNDVANDPRVKFKREHAERGIGSLAAFPLTASDKLVGVLALHAAEPGFFDDDEVRLLTELAGDISFALEHIEKGEKLDYLAYYDSITGLANRTLFRERLEQHLREAAREQRQLAVVIVDIDRFRTVNDTFGRQAGDALLKQIAARFLEVAGDPGVLARLSADHFAVAVPHVRAEQDLVRMIEAARSRMLAEPFSVEGTELRIATKAGIALFPSDGGDADTLLRNAEAALRKAKASGERHVFYTQQMTEKVAEKLSLENKLRQALEKDEFVLHYQPKVDLNTRSIVGVEALIRWQSPELGLVPPGRFIPLLEETGLILEVGAWALTRAALDHRAWVEARMKPVRVAVNVSAIQLRQRDFVSMVELAVLEGIAPVGIDLEITESLIMEDVEATIEKLKEVQGLGIRMAIDDFGTGYSSLAYLAKLPVETLKIDRSFVIKMLGDPDTATLVQTIITLAHSLRLTVVAEGVDAEEQANVLRLLRCDQMQGYLFSKPLPLDQMTALLASPDSAATA